MKKQLLAAAVATAIAAPMAATAGDVTIYGNIHVEVSSVDAESAVGNMYAGLHARDEIAGAGAGVDYDGLVMHSPWNWLGVKGKEDLGNGLSAIFKLEFLVNPSDNIAVTHNRNSYIGLQGAWGTFLMGRDDSPVKKSTAAMDVFGNTMGDFNGNAMLTDRRLANMVSYYSPNYNGFSFGAAAAMPSTDNGTGAANSDSDGIETWSAALRYKNGPWTAALGYEEMSQEANALAATAGAEDSELWRAAIGWKANGLKLGLIYEDHDLAAANAAGGDREVWVASAAYTMGNNTVKFQYADRDHDAPTGFADNDGETWSIGLDHKLSKRTKAFVYYTDAESSLANTDWDVFSVGLRHMF